MATPSNQMVNLAQRVSDASTLQSPGRVATAHYRLVSQPLAGDTVQVQVGPVTSDGTFTAGSSVTYTFTTTGSVPDATIPVPIGPDLATTTATLAQTIMGQQSAVLIAAAHAVDVGVVDVAGLVPGAAVTIAASGLGVTVQNNSEALGKQQYQFWVLRRTVTPEDVTRGRLRCVTGCRTILATLVRLTAGPQDLTPDPYNGVITTDGGVIELAQGSGTGRFIAGNILEIQAYGVL
jgi:hypothetical protein